MIYLTKYHLLYLLIQTKNIVTAFKEGFETVFPIKHLKCFTSVELEEVLCGSETDNNWDSETLENNIHTNHGYTKNSNNYKYLIKFLTSLNALDRKTFILFVTGCPRLPIGGLKSLNPKMTIVKRISNNISDLSPDQYLPTVMT